MAMRSAAVTRYPLMGKCAREWPGVTGQRRTMRNLIRVLLVGLFCLGVAAVAVTVLINPKLLAWRHARNPKRHEEGDRASGSSSAGKGTGPRASRPSSTSSWTRSRMADTDGRPVRRTDQRPDVAAGVAGIGSRAGPARDRGAEGEL